MRNLDLGDYPCFDPGIDRPLRDVSIKEARAHFDLMLREKDFRISELKKLLLKSEIQLEYTEVSIQTLNRWFLKNLSEVSERTKAVPDIWFSIVNDIGLFLADYIMKKVPHISMQLCVKPKRDVSFQRPVLVGFKNSPIKDEHVDIDFAIGTYAHRIGSGDEQNEKFFIELIHSVLDIA